MTPVPEGGLSVEQGLVQAQPAKSVRYAADIPGHAIGTVIRWGVEVCDQRGNCRTDPLVYPHDAYQFRVGILPSRPEIDAVTPAEGPAELRVVGKAKRGEVLKVLATDPGSPRAETTLPSSS